MYRTISSAALRPDAMNSGPTERVAGPGASDVHSLVADATAALESASGGDLARVRACLADLARLLSAATPDTAVRPRTGGLAPWQLRLIDRHVAANLHHTIGIAELAALARVSPSHLCRAFKASTGDTPHGYVTMQRIRRAQSLLLTTDWPLSRIADRTGMADQAHLSRLFRRHVGIGPLQWRRTWQQA